MAVKVILGHALKKNSNVFYSPGLCPVAEGYSQSGYLTMEMCNFMYSDEEIKDVLGAFDKVWENLVELKTLMVYRGRTLLFAAHDAGAAEILLAIARRNKTKNNIKLNLKGPAKEIFERSDFHYNSDISNFNLEKQILVSDLVITGTSQKNSHELETIKIARDQSKKTISLLDHWTNYKERFFTQQQPDFARPNLGFR